MNNEEKKAVEFIKDLINWDVRQDLCPNKEECEKLETVLNLIEKLQKELKDLQEYKRISELTKISCCTAQNCEALNTAIKGELENQKLRQENEELKEKRKKKNIEPVLIGNKMYFIDKGLYEDLLNDIKSNYILIQKITDKMEKLNKEIKNAETIEAVFKIKQQQALQELLEESEEIYE